MDYDPTYILQVQHSICEVQQSLCIDAITEPQSDVLAYRQFGRQEYVKCDT